MDLKKITDTIPGENGDPNRLRPLLSIWTLPEKTIKYVWTTQPDLYLHRLYMALGVAFVLAARVPDWLMHNPNPIGVMIQVLLAGPVGGIVGGYVLSEGIRATGGWFGGEASKDAIRITVAWTHIPFIGAYMAYLLSYVILFLVLSPTDGSPIIPLFSQGAIGYIPLVVLILVFGYAMTIRIRGVAEVQEISIGKALLNHITGFILVVGPVIGMLIVYAMVAKSSLSLFYK